MNFKKHVLLVILLPAVACSRMPLSSRGLASRDLETGYEYVNPNEILFGVEYSFQDRELMNQAARQCELIIKRRNSKKCLINF
jgi:hypothetical protein